MANGLKHAPAHLLSQVVNMIQNDNPFVKQLCQEIHMFSLNQKQSENMMKARNEYIRLIRDYLNSATIANQLEEGVRIDRVAVFGSFITQCVSNNSDLDLCICLNLEFGGKSRISRMPVTVLQSVYRDLQHNRNLKQFFGDNRITHLSFVSSAKVPIIKFKMNGIAIDLSAIFCTSPPSSCVAAKFINAYCQLDDRFVILVTFIKTWLRSEGDPNDHLREFPNSYALTILLIHALQWYGIVPNLYESHNEMFNPQKVKSWDDVDVGHEFTHPLDENTVAMHRRKETSKLTVVQLLYLFACHYSEGTLLANHTFNMKNGSIEPRRGREAQVSIVDIYDTKNPARSTRSQFYVMNALSLMRMILLAPAPNMLHYIMQIPFRQFMPPVLNHMQNFHQTNQMNHVNYYHMYHPNFQHFSAMPYANNQNFRSNSASNPRIPPRPNHQETEKQYIKR
ncbi:hypothetical protein L3Y34_017752 [Caenorhabditis briggsae]|uniref:Poly(A) RNA polymerase mitochondrial-like central palm domain-containing protein n=3 Tax=Caenorhabditis briggsae TaxID=6238 RepID=A0AAE9DJN0_CAEBR|nr:hypothetical protein L3Y34_017752 [Caenorhabditis briggsae]